MARTEGRIGPSTPLVSLASKGRLRRARKLVSLLRDPAYWRPLTRGVAATTEHASVPFPTDIACVIDVGSHTGQFAVFALARFAGAHVYCIEPLERPRARIARAVGANPRVTIIPSAAAARAGRRQLHVSRMSDSSSLMTITKTYTTAFPGTEETGTVQINAAPLDDLLLDRDLPRPLLLKIDVQGGELEALLGAQDLLGQTDVVFVECSFVEFYAGQPLIGDIICYLVARGFRLAGTYSVVRDDMHRCLQADLLFDRT